MVVGDPGSGKSTLTQYLAWLVTDPKTPLLIGGNIKIPAIVELRTWVNKQSRLVELLTDEFPKTHRRAPQGADWKRWLDAGQVLLLIDGLDEADDPAFLRLLKQELDTYKTCPVVITCRNISRSLLNEIGFGDTNHAINQACPVYQPSLFDAKQQEAYIRAYAAVSDNKFKADWLLSRWNQLTQYHFLARNPLLLSMICYVAQELEGQNLPATRTQLYDEAVEKLLDAHLRKEGTVVARTAAGTEIETSEKRRMLEILALRLLMDDTTDQRPTSFSDETASMILKAIAYKGHRDHITVAEDVLSDVTQNTRLFITRNQNTGKSYQFLHRTFHEFLAACALSRQAASITKKKAFPGNEHAWKSVFDSIEREWTFTLERQENIQDWTLDNWVLFVDKKAWLPSWQEVYIFLAGKMDDPVPLLDLLADRYVMRDDIFRHRLALAVHCAAEAAGQFAPEMADVAS